MDARDEVTWLICELTPQGERAAEEGNLETLLRSVGRVPPQHPIFVPCLSYVYNGRKSVFSVMEGYAFLSSGVESSVIKLLSNSQYVRRVLSQGNGIRRSFETVSDAKIREIRQQLNSMVGEEIQVGMTVRVIEGPLLGIIGEVLDCLENQNVILKMSMRSIHILKEIPRAILQPIGEDEDE